MYICRILLIQLLGCHIEINACLVFSVNTELLCLLSFKSCFTVSTQIVLCLLSLHYVVFAPNASLLLAVYHHRNAKSAGTISFSNLCIHSLLYKNTGVVVSALASINEVNQRRAGLVLRCMTVSRFNSRCRTFISVCNQPATQGQLSLP